jgi:hypothetical protein
MSKRNRERRQQRQQQRKQGTTQPSASGAEAPSHERAEAEAFLRNFERAAEVPQPTSWPGACDASLERPDLVKMALGEFALHGDPGRAKNRQLQRDLANGILGDVPSIKDWAMEEFLWHGLPGDSWHPIDAFLVREAARFSPAACEQLRRWKDARIGFFEIGPVQGDCVVLREWDPIEKEPCGPDFPSISLNIGGVNLYRERQDAISLTYVAPWTPEIGLMCALGYGLMLEPRQAAWYLPLLGLRRPDVVARPLPWKASPVAQYEYAKTWRQRSWHDWLAERLEFPFLAMVGGPGVDPQLKTVRSLLPSTPEEVRDFGIYFGLDDEVERVAVGATAVLPSDVTTDNALPLAEYRAYREIVGPPRAVRAASHGLEFGDADAD